MTDFKYLLEKVMGTKDKRYIPKPSDVEALSKSIERFKNKLKQNAKQEKDRTR